MPDVSLFSPAATPALRLPQSGAGLPGRAVYLWALGLALAWLLATLVVVDRTTPIDNTVGGPDYSRGVAQPAPVVAVAEAYQAEASSVAQASTVAAQEAPAVDTSSAAVVSESAPAAVAVPAAPQPQPVVAQPQTPAERWRAEGIILETEGQEWDATSLANVDAALSKLPAAVRASLGSRALGPLRIVVNSQGRALSGKQPYGRAANFFSTNDGVNELVLYPRQSAATVLHELGHAYNLRTMPAGRYALVLLDAEMASFMAATGWQLVSTPDQVRAARDQTQVAYAYDGGFVWPRLSHEDPLEDFANSFALFFLDPAELQRLSPARYDWFAANLNR